MCVCEHVCVKERQNDCAAFALNREIQVTNIEKMKGVLGWLCMLCYILKLSFLCRASKR